MDKRITTNGIEITRMEKNVPIIETPAEIKMFFEKFIVVLDKLDGRWTVINKRHVV